MHEAIPLLIDVVKDDVGRRNKVAAVLEQMGFAVRRHADAASFYRETVLRRGDVAVLDVDLPGESGISIAGHMRRVGEVGLILLSTRDSVGDRLEALQKRLASDPNWNGGWYYDNGGIARTLEELRFETLMNYGQNEILAETMPDPKAREAAIRANAKVWSQIYDGHSMVVLRRAIGSFDITADYARLKNTKVLYVQSSSDKLFDIALSPGYVSDMRRAGIDVTYVELPTNKGHMASHADAALWAPILGAFLKRLT